MDDSEATLELRIHGPFTATWSDGKEQRLKGAKQQAFVALLACSPSMVRTRSWLQAMLWGKVDQKLGRASLRQALSNLKGEFGDRFDRVFDVESDRVGLRQGAVRLVGGASEGEFLESLDVGEDAFEDWLREMRLSDADASPAMPMARPGAAQPDASLRPKIAVLPFVNYPPNDEIGYMGDAIAQELIRTLSRSQLIDMISHLSSRSFDPEVADVVALRKALDIDYLVTGRCIISEDKLLLDVDFHDVRSHNLLWSERFETTQECFFNGSSDFVTDLALEVVRSVLASSIELGSIRPMPSVSTHALMMSSIGLMHHMSPANFSRSFDHLGEVIERAPGHSIPRAWRAQWFLLRVFQGWSTDVNDDHAQAASDTLIAMEQNPQCSFSLAIDANVKTVLQGDFDAAKSGFERALELNPSSAVACQLKSLMHSFMGEGDEAVTLSERARMLSPCDPRSHFFDALSAAAYLSAGEYDKAVELSEKSLRINPRHVSALRARVVALEMLGRHGAAQAAAIALLQREPELTVQSYLDRHPAARSNVGQEWAKALGSAGVPSS